MIEYLTFDRFVTPHVMILFYYFAAIGIPLFVFFYKGDFIVQKYKQFSPDLSPKNTFRFWAAVLMLFFCMELCWRMIFEMIIAYFDIHDFLYHMEQSLEQGNL